MHNLTNSSGLSVGSGLNSVAVERGRELREDLVIELGHFFGNCVSLSKNVIGLVGDSELGHVVLKLINLKA